jgi:hypothetical protein
MTGDCLESELEYVCVSPQRHGEHEGCFGFLQVLCASVVIIDPKHIVQGDVDDRGLA